MTSKAVANGFRGLSLILFGFCFSLVVGWAIDFDAMFNIDKVLGSGNYSGKGLPDFFIMAITILVGQAASVGVIIAHSISVALGVIISRIPILGDLLPNDGTSADGIRWLAFYMSEISKSTLPHADVGETDPLQIVLGFLGSVTALLFLLLLPITFLSGIGFIRDGDTKLVITSFLSMQIILCLAIITDHLGPSIRIYETTPSTPLDLLVRPLFFIGFMVYLYLELSFQTSYALNIIEPMAEREQRIQAHIKRIKTFVPEKEEGETIKGLGQQGKGMDILALSYLREMVEKRVMKKGKSGEDAKSTMRLQGYLENLKQTDENMENKLTAMSAQPEGRKIILHLIPMVAFRIVVVILLGFAVLNPNVFITGTGLSNLAPLVDSVELEQPEFRTVALLNIVMIIVALSAVLHWAMVGKKKVERPIIQKIDTLVEFEELSNLVEEESEEEEQATPS